MVGFMPNPRAGNPQIVIPWNGTGPWATSGMRLGIGQTH